jgi:hypothetical protein
VPEGVPALVDQANAAAYLKFGTAASIAMVSPSSILIQAVTTEIIGTLMYGSFSGGAPAASGYISFQTTDGITHKLLAA